MVIRQQFHRLWNFTICGAVQLTKNATQLNTFIQLVARFDEAGARLGGLDCLGQVIEAFVLSTPGLLSSAYRMASSKFGRWIRGERALKPFS